MSFPQHRPRPFRCAIAVALFWLAVPAVHASEEGANKLFVDATLLINNAKEATPAKAVGLYERALANLDDIVHSHSDSRLAVELVSGQSIGAISRDVVEQGLRSALAVACPDGPTPICVLAIAEESAAQLDDHVPEWVIDDIAQQVYALAPADDALAFAERHKGERGAVNIEVVRAYLARRAAADGQPDRARMLMASTNYQGNDSGERAQIYRYLAAAAKLIGDADGADRFLSMLQQLSATDAIFHQAAAEMEFGHAEDAILTAATIVDKDARGRAFAALASIAADASDFDVAIQCLEQIDDAANSARAALTSIAIAQAKAGLADAAKQTASRIVDSDARQQVLLAMVTAQPATFDIDRLLADANALTWQTDKLRLISSSARIAAAEAQLGRSQSALVRLTQARLLARDYPEDELVGQLYDIAAARVWLGEAEAALFDTQLIRSDTKRIYTLIEIAQALSAAGKN